MYFLDAQRLRTPCHADMPRMAARSYHYQTMYLCSTACLKRQRSDVNDVAQVLVKYTNCCSELAIMPA